MNAKVFKTLEYTKIIERLTELAGSSIGKELCRNLKPSSNLAEIEAAQKQTSDALSRIYQRGSISFSPKKGRIASTGNSGAIICIREYPSTM